MNLNIGNHKLLSDAVQNGFVAFGPAVYEQMAMTAQAIEMIRQRAYANIQCNAYFQSLPNRRTFNEIYTNGNVWISYGKDRFTDWSGLCITDNKQFDIAINTKEFSFAKQKPAPVEYIASIIVHELAHVGGAPEYGSWAEVSKMCCGFGAYFDPTVVG